MSRVSRQSCTPSRLARPVCTVVGVSLHGYHIAPFNVGPLLEPGDYFGTTTQRYGGNGISFVETHFATDLVIPQHEHVNPFFCFVLDGRGTRSWPSRRGADAPMLLTLFPAAVPHANCWDGAGGKALHVEFSPLWLHRFGGRTGVLDRPDGR